MVMVASEFFQCFTASELLSQRSSCARQRPREPRQPVRVLYPYIPSSNYPMPGAKMAGTGTVGLGMIRQTPAAAACAPRAPLARARTVPRGGSTAMHFI